MARLTDTIWKSFSIDDKETISVSYFLNVDIETLRIDEEIANYYDTIIEKKYNKIIEISNRIDCSIQYNTEKIENLTDEIIENCREKALEFINLRINDIQNLKKNEIFKNVIRKQKLNKINDEK